MSPCRWTAGRRATVLTAAGSAIRAPSSLVPLLAGPGQRPSGDRALDEGHGCQEGPDLLADQLQIQQRGTSSTQRFGDTDGRTGQIGERGPQLGIEATRLAGPNDVGRAMVGEETVKDLDNLLLFGGEIEVHCRNSLRSVDG